MGTILLMEEKHQGYILALVFSYHVTLGLFNSLVLNFLISNMEVIRNFWFGSKLNELKKVEPSRYSVNVGL